ncbi:MAG: hypothetical protein Q9M35_12380 [Rhodothermus sp.]|nr:hypothetical protein [Rhodothermus sp.]
MRTVTLLVFLWSVLAGCKTESSSPQSPLDFFARTEQSLRQRLIKARLQAVDSLNLSAFELYEPSQLCQSDQYLFVFERNLGKIAVFGKDLRGHPFFIGKGRGEGPGEVTGISDMDVHHGRIYLFSSARLVVWSIADTLVLDKKIGIEAYRGEVVDEHRLLILSPTSPAYLFNIIDLEGKVVRGFASTNLGKVMPLCYSGDLAFDGRYFYYAGESEPFIKKYTLEGRQLFSVATIDNLPSEGNYVQFEADGESMAMGYSPWALFSTAMIEVYDAYLLVVPIHDEHRKRLSYLDVYATQDGRYLATYDLARMPMALAVDDNGIYTLEREGGDVYLKRYPNVLTALAQDQRSTP